MKKIIVCGSRTFTDRAFLERKLDEALRELGISSLELVVGACPTGADRMAEEWADTLLERKETLREDKGTFGSFAMVTISRFPADWKRHGKAAGPIRNRNMAEYAGKKGVCIAFRNAGRSPGTDNMIAEAEKIGMKVIVYRVGEGE